MQSEVENNWSVHIPAADRSDAVTCCYADCREVTHFCVQSTQESVL